MVANLNCDAGYTNATAFFSSKLIVDNKGGSIYVCSEAKYGDDDDIIVFPVFRFAHTGYFTARGL
ncbi:hypothetical protein AYM02_03075 [Coxiella burnetii]|uniref:hypothetical protein n=1 Tax=Coxiella burnetii TaxID=777 RepID=UPI0003AA299A|nr:hypothetical protein AYM02_03075 [Coxiella burnetii]